MRQNKTKSFYLLTSELNNNIKHIESGYIYYKCGRSLNVTKWL